jgi:hypothetical protein
MRTSRRLESDVWVPFYSALTPVLTPDQRTQRAADIRRHADSKRIQGDK